MRQQGVRMLRQAIGTALVAVAAVTAQVTIDSADVAGWKGGEYLSASARQGLLAAHPFAFGGQQVWDLSWADRDSFPVEHVYFRPALPDERDSLPLASIARLQSFNGSGSEDTVPFIRMLALSAQRYYQVGHVERDSLGTHILASGRCEATLLQLPATLNMRCADTAVQICTDGKTTWDKYDSLHCHSYGTVRLPGGAVLDDVLGVREAYWGTMDGYAYVFLWYSKSVGLVARLVVSSYPVGDPAPYLLTAGSVLDTSVVAYIWDLDIMYLTPQQGAVQPPSSGGLAKSGRATQPSAVYTLAGRQAAAAARAKDDPAGVLVQVVDRRPGRTALVVR